MPLITPSLYTVLTSSSAATMRGGIFFLFLKVVSLSSVKSAAVKLVYESIQIAISSLHPQKNAILTFKESSNFKFN